MKYLVIVFSLLLAGCGTIDKVKQMWPRPHDPAGATGLINLSISLNMVDCKNKETIASARRDAEWLNRYAEFRNEAQKVSTKAIVENLDKATGASDVVCARWVNLSKTRIKIIEEAWSGR